jgi:phospholipid/cholesterol/gamma-HCH transport system substrate-binding protein
METNVNYTVVGAFVIILVAFLVFGIIWLSSGFSVQTFTTYQIYMQESVTGLSIDAPVEYNGVNVGEVKTIELNRKNPHLVEVLLNIKTNTPITLGTTATLETKGITGIAYIALKDKSTDLTPLKALGNQPYPVIRTTPSLLLRLDTALNKLNDSFSRVSEAVSSLFDPQNQRSIKETLKNIDRITNTLAASSQKFTILLNNTAEASQQFSPTMTMFSTQTIPAMNNILYNLDSLSADVKNNPSILIRGNAQQPLGPGER